MKEDTQCHRNWSHCGGHVLLLSNIPLRQSKKKILGRGTKIARYLKSRILEYLKFMQIKSNKCNSNYWMRMKGHLSYYIHLWRCNRFLWILHSGRII